mmetsp:Transcript_56689/g.97650  ORF Transcript_56689/g.97650 Transcript_56689/m.97650 type:complete len:220 (+) Transcript_56689:273-932(+)
MIGIGIGIGLETIVFTKFVCCLCPPDLRPVGNPENNFKALDLATVSHRIQHESGSLGAIDAWRRAEADLTSAFHTSVKLEDLLVHERGHPVEFDEALEIGLALEVGYPPVHAHVGGGGRRRGRLDGLGAQEVDQSHHELCWLVEEEGALFVLLDVLIPPSAEVRSEQRIFVQAQCPTQYTDARAADIKAQYISRCTTCHQLHLLLHAIDGLFQCRLSLF